MGFLSFYPWFTIKERATLGDCILEPVDVTAPPTNDEERQIRNILQRYHDKSNRPIREATLIYKDGTPKTQDPTDEEINDVFIVSEMIAFSGLSARRFFSWDYLNRDTLRLVGQRFKDSQDSPSITSRRRDGQTLEGFSRDVFIEKCPQNVSLLAKEQLDFPLAESLCKLYRSKDDLWLDVYDAILGFNNANTDRNEIRETAEIVHTCGAFERLFGYSQAKVVPKFVHLLSKVPTATNLKYVRKHGSYVSNQNPATVREAWIRDFYKTRNEVGHGKSQAQHDKTWDITEHLLLAAYIFPLVMKMFLQEHCWYSLTDKDKERVFAYDYFLNVPHTHGQANKDDPDSHYWGEVRGAARWDYMGKKCTV